VDGLLIIDKPAGPTSHDVVNRVRRILNTRKVGHTGTLDPFATGVLVLVIGKATRLAQFLDKDDKEYDAMIRFGFQTDTGDRTGSRIAECEMPNEEIVRQLAGVSWRQTLSKFSGEIEQLPPMYSAKKVEGKKLYESARKGIDVDRKPVKVTIHELEVLSSGDTSMSIRVACSAGTYIRTLAEDIGRVVGVGAHLEELRRTRAGRFSISQSLTLDKLENADDPSKLLLPMDEVVAHLPRFTLANDRIEKTMNGLATRVEREDLKTGDAVRMLDGNGGIVAIGTYQSKESSIKPKIVLV